MTSQELMSFLPLIIVLLGAGVISGFVAGLLGVGGGIVMVPVLYEILPLLNVDDSVRMHIAVATSLAAMIATSISSVRAHYQRGAIDLELLKRIAPFIFLGAVVGSIIGGRVANEALVGLFSIIAFLVAIWIAVGRDSQQLASKMPKGLGNASLGSSIGGISVLMGIGGGTLGVPTLTAFNVPIRRAVATSSTFGLLIAVPGVIGFVQAGWNIQGMPPGNLGFVSLIGVAIIAPVTALMAPLGAKVAHTIAPRRLRFAFAGFLVITAIRMGYAAIN